MANAGYYDPGPTRKPNLVVGTPGLNTAPGQTFRALAQQMGQVRQQLGQEKTQAALGRLQTSGMIGSSVGSLIGRTIKSAVQQNQQVQQQKQQNVANQAVTNGAYNFLNSARQAQQQAQQQYVREPPSKAPRRLAAWLDAQGDAAQQMFSQQFDPTNNPQYGGQANQLLQHVNSAKLSLNKQMGDWATDSQMAGNMALSASTVNQAVSDIGTATGSIQDRFLNFKQTANMAASYVQTSAPSLDYGATAAQPGKNTTKLLNDLHQKAPVAFFQNLAAEMPSNPEEALQHINTARRMLDNSNSPNSPIRLDPDDKLHLQTLYDSAQNKVVHNMEGHLQVQELAADSGNKAYKQQLDANWQDPVMQQEALNNAGKQVQTLSMKAQQVAQDQSLPDNLKQVWLKSLNTQITSFDTQTNAAKANLKSFEIAQEKGVNAAIAERDKQQAETEKLAKAQMKETGDAAQVKLNGMVNNLYALGQKPVDNAAQIQEASKELYTYAGQMGAAKYLTPPEMQHYQTSALTAVSGAAEWQRNNPNLFGMPLPTIGQPTVKHLKNDQAQQARSAAVNKLVQSVGDIHSMASQSQTNQVQGLGTGQQSYFNENYAGWLQARNAIGKPPTQLEKDQFSLKLRAQALQQKDTAPAPARTQLSGKVGVSEGYAGVQGFPGLVEPGNLDLTHRQIVDNPDGSYGTEFSMSFNDGKHEVLIPTIYDGKHHTNEQAIEHYHETGEHMGKFAPGDYKRADAYAEKLHNRTVSLNGAPYHGKGMPAPKMIKGKPVLIAPGHRGFVPPPPPTVPTIDPREFAEFQQWKAQRGDGE